MIVTIIYPEGESDKLEVNSTEVTVGRGATNDIVVSDDQISRVHLGIKAENDTLYIKDLTLSNWVSYNDEKLSKIDYVQYFDFAKLVLPGGISLKISMFDEEDSSELENSIESITSTHRINREKTSSINSKKKTNKRERKSKNLVKKDEKGMKEFFVMAFVLIAVGVFVTMKLIDVKPLPVVKLTPGYTKKSLEENKKKLKEAKAISPEFKATFIDLNNKTKKCTSEKEKQICGRVYSQIHDGEGVSIIGGTVFIFKNLESSAQELFKDSNRIKKASKNLSYLYAVAAEKVTVPSTISVYKNYNLNRIIIFLFSKKGAVELKAKFLIKRSQFDGLKTSRQRKSMKSVRKFVDFNLFNQEIKLNMYKIK
jgi:hypothetical protein